MTVEDARALVEVSKRTNRVCAVNYGYSGCPMIRQMRAMVAAGQLGVIRKGFAEFAGGFMADAADADNPRLRWRFDPKQAGMAAVTVDCGTHGLHPAPHVTGQNVVSLSSDFVSGITSRELEDDNFSALRLTGGTVWRLWTGGAMTACIDIPPFIPTPGMLVAARGVAVLYNAGDPIIGLTDGYKALGAGITPVIICLLVAILFHVLLTPTLYGRRT